jgi:hypothetical protein
MATRAAADGHARFLMHCAAHLIPSITNASIFYASPHAKMARLDATISALLAMQELRLMLEMLKALMSFTPLRLLRWLALPPPMATHAPSLLLFHHADFAASSLSTRTGAAFALPRHHFDVAGKRVDAG